MPSGKPKFFGYKHKFMKRNFIQYGCGLSAPNDWINFDASPTLRIQKFPILGRIVKSRPCRYNDSEDQMFKLVEDKDRFENSLAFEAIK